MLDKESLVKVEVLTITKRIADQIKSISMDNVVYNIDGIKFIGYIGRNAFSNGSSPYVLLMIKDTGEIALLLCTNIEQFKARYSITNLPQIFVK